MTVINTNTASINAQYNLNKVNKEMEAAMEQLSSGKRINTASDDAAGMAIASRITSEVKGIEMAIRNSSDAQALIDTAEGAHNEIENICNLFKSATDKNKLVLMHTVSSYPAELETLRMDTIDWMQTEHSGFSYGYSSHEQNVISASASVYKGIDWLERHFTLDKEMWGTDQGASSDPQDMSELVGTIRMLEKTLGVREGVLDCEKDNMRKMR